ncbi:succinylglutamate desuccinylase/aspartoacylase family protein [Bradyrhizobium sp. Ec3.3]|uniref:succinylglutamate desuccinylase/aspartoacylase family protein n=1 Tax=Bradyrhizobium sp. Ec3.3 TaxID=189753 RepID=UPI00040E496A|nr:succinylglutamate desuccinylase/aspartoacylase family protein [Bradyrhizobium sp. Ec3.3]
MRLNIDIDKQGRQTGTISLASSTDDSAYRQIQIPVVAFRNGDGPRILLMAGNHGDEFEGQIILTRLARQLDFRHVRGRLLLLPAVNLPAALAGTRTSPLDNGNLNRSFPGDPRGTPTERIADFVEKTLIPKSAFLIDLHSGGNSLNYVPGPSITDIEDENARSRLLGILRSFGSPVGYVFSEPPTTDVGTIGCCRRAGIERLGTELGGGGGVSPAAVTLGETGVLRVLTYLGALDSAATADLPPPGPMRILRRPGPYTYYYLYAESAGVFDPFIELGAQVSQGQPVGQILAPELPWREPITVHAKVAGTLICRRSRGLTRRGDGLMVFAEDLPC